MGEPGCLGTMGDPQTKGDGNCDSENNNESCDFDGGDCCGYDVPIGLCIDPNSIHFGM